MKKQGSVEAPDGVKKACLVPETAPFVADQRRSSLPVSLPLTDTRAGPVPLEECPAIAEAAGRNVEGPEDRSRPKRKSLKKKAMKDCWLSFRRVENGTVYCCLHFMNDAIEFNFNLDEDEDKDVARNLVGVLATCLLLFILFFFWGWGGSWGG